MDYKDLIMKFAASYTLADHLGDVGNDVDYLLKQIGFDDEWSDQDELYEILSKMGVTTLYDTKLGE